MRYIAVFEDLTGVDPIDCVIDDDRNRLTFIVKRGCSGTAIGKSGANIDKVKRSVKKRVEIIEHSDDMYEFIHNIFRPALIKRIDVIEKGGRKLAFVHASENEKGIVIGKNGRNLKRAKTLIQRHHGFDNVIIK
jgi:N utilization substance protein A